MTPKVHKFRLLLTLTALSAILLVLAQFTTKNSTAPVAYYSFNEKGELIRPTNYRTWVFVGACATPKSKDQAAIFPDFQNIYIDPAGYAFWKENGYFKERTILVKELLCKGDTIAPIGRGFFQGDYYSLSATIKDTARFKDVPGGWQYFKFTNYKKGMLTASSPMLGQICISCHSHSKAGVGPFTEFYPVLRDAKRFGKDAPENMDTRKGLIPQMPSYMQEKDEYTGN